MSKSKYKVGDGISIYSVAHTRPKGLKRIYGFFYYWLYLRWKPLSKEAVCTIDEL